MAEVDVVIVNWNSGAFLSRCVDSLLIHGGADLAKVFLVDNGSTDGSMGFVAGPSDQVEKVFLGTNAGFAKACNRGAEKGRAPYILFFNPDAELHPDCLRRSLDFMNSPAAAQVGICGVQLIGDDGQVEKTCARFPSVRTFMGRATGLHKVLPGVFPPHYLTDFDHRESRPVDEVMGAYFLVRRELFERLGGFDERYFVYFEELDFALQARQAGWGTYFLATASAYHKGGGVSSQVKAHRLFYSLRSRMLYSFKHMGRVRGGLVWLITMGLEPITRTVLALARCSRADVRNTWSGYRMLWADMPATLRTAWQMGRAHGST
ncbi:MAG: glycosyltransferase family 2 protein [Burkholderiales bacterium]|nr:glycosyltransferase family 2 protein [Burkholderiales bacterium]